jgi:hypothetical protein
MQNEQGRHMQAEHPAEAYAASPNRVVKQIAARQVVQQLGENPR